MFETTYLLKVTESALRCEELQKNYTECWTDLPKLYTGEMDPYKSNASENEDKNEK